MKQGETRAGGQLICSEFELTDAVLGHRLRRGKTIFVGVQHQGLEVNVGQRVNVDKTGRDELAYGQDHGIDRAGIVRAHVDDAVVFIDNDTVPQDRMMALLKADYPTTLNQRACHCRYRVCDNKFNQ